ncbi:putative tyrosine protein kinase [Trypanosoma grayi]|uniref:putative tyrosine protein kinase n=1 Tax=Trypanosoma grayi TaxID=71804 RepID=UPI0004F41A3A|nr:putative tyrosine protein kinase [Trypanosoma grayi]KEG06865.1 putative tyrosine protein kinase [Trypanosoma grayi]
MNFTVLRKIAEGACAEVFLVQLKQQDVVAPTSEEDNLAVLKLAKPGCEVPAIVEAVELRRITSHGTHPHIVAVFGYLEGDRIPRGLLLEYCRGGSLGDYLRGATTARHATAPPESEGSDDDSTNNGARRKKRRGSGCNVTSEAASVTIPVAVARRLFSQLLDALLFLETMKLWHRDLKPDNILLTSPDVSEASIKLSDFGFARRTPLSSLRSGKTSAVGSPAFLSPERLHQFVLSTRAVTTSDAEGPASYCRSRAEVWAAGLILYSMVRGRYLFGSVRSVEELMAAQANVQTTLQHDRGLCEPGAEELLHLLQSMLQPDPARRAEWQVVKNHPWLCRETGTVTEATASAVDAGTAVPRGVSNRSRMRFSAVSSGRVEPERVAFYSCVSETHGDKLSAVHNVDQLIFIPLDEEEEEESPIEPSSASRRGSSCTNHSEGSCSSFIFISANDFVAASAPEGISTNNDVTPAPVATAPPDDESEKKTSTEEPPWDFWTTVSQLFFSGAGWFTKEAWTSP